jgi:hypothetical protein
MTRFLNNLSIIILTFQTKQPILKDNYLLKMLIYNLSSYSFPSVLPKPPEPLVVCFIFSTSTILETSAFRKIN